MKKWPAVVYIALFALAAAFRFLALKNGFVNDQTIHILVNRDMPVAARDADTGWPCFRSPATEIRSHPPA